MGLLSRLGSSKAKDRFRRIKHHISRYKHRLGTKSQTVSASSNYYRSPSLPREESPKVASSTTSNRSSLSSPSRKDVKYNLGVDLIVHVDNATAASIRNEVKNFLKKNSDHSFTTLKMANALAKSQKCLDSHSNGYELKLRETERGSVNLAGIKRAALSLFDKSIAVSLKSESKSMQSRCEWAQAIIRLGKCPISRDRTISSWKEAKNILEEVILFPPSLQKERTPMARYKKLSVSVYKKNRDCFLDWRDKIAIFSLIQHLWIKNRCLFLICDTDKNGRITFLGDDATKCRWVLRRGILYYLPGSSSTRVSKDSRLDRWAFSGHQDLSDCLFPAREPIQLPFLKQIAFYNPFQTFEAIASWSNGLELPKLNALYFGPDHSHSPNVPPLLHLLGSRLAAQITNIWFESGSQSTKKNYKVLPLVEELSRFSKLSTLRLPRMTMKHFVVFLDLMTTHERCRHIFLRNSLTYLGVPNLTIVPDAEQTAKVFLSTFGKVESLCGFQPFQIL